MKPFSYFVFELRSRDNTSEEEEDWKLCKSRWLLSSMQKTSGFDIKVENLNVDTF